MESVDPILMSYLPNDVRSMFLPYVSVELGALILNLVIGFIIASAIGFHFRKYASSFCNRQDFSRLFPLLMLTIILIISVVKASLALALGLVGALSIVRFRTPIKEPEELLYLFFTIGVAVSLGAGQTFAAVVGSAVTLGLVTWAKNTSQNESEENGLFLMLSLDDEALEKHNISLADCKNILEKYVDRMTLRRFDLDDDHFDATFFINVNNDQQIDACNSEFKQRFPGVSISMLEQHNVAGV